MPRAAVTELQEYHKFWFEKVRPRVVHGRGVTVSLSMHSHLTSQGNVSLWITLAFTLIGAVIVADGHYPNLGRYALSFGLFGFAGRSRAPSTALCF